MRPALLPLLLALPANALAAPLPPTPPKLIVAISVDQFSANLFEEWRPRFTGGLKRLSGGIAFPSGYQSHAATETCPGHSTLLTGRHPNKTGIVANTMRDEATGKSVYCLADDTVVLAHDAAAPAVGPKRLMADTLGEWLKAASPQSRVVGVSGKDRGAITMVGHAPDGVFWTMPGYGFTTYMRPGGDATAALAPVAAVNAAQAKAWRTRPTWTYRHPECRALAGDWSIGETRFASKLPPTGYGTSDKPGDIARNVMVSPMNDAMTLAGAQAMLRHYRLGKGPATDLLTVSFSATDLIGHTYGSRGPEMCEQMHALDTAIGTLLADVDKLGVPYLVVLSADHGGSDLTERLAVRGFPARRVDTAAIVERVNRAAMAAAGLAAPPFEGGLDELAIARDVPPADRPRVLAAAKAVLAKEPDVAGAFTIDELLATPIPHGTPADELTLRERFAESAWRGRSGDLMVALRPELTANAKAGGAIAGHGSPWNYDRRVPILFWWKGAPAETRFLPVETTDIAPTLAATLGITPPDDVDGRCLPLAAPCPAQNGVKPPSVR
ncbi:MAG: alkaline phosphatase family protein [Sphingomonas sp.]